MDISELWSATDPSDPKWNEFLRQLQIEDQRMRFEEQVQILTRRCSDVCFPGYRIPSRIDTKTHNCISNCVNRMVDGSNFMVDYLKKLIGKTDEMPK